MPSDFHGVWWNVICYLIGLPGMLSVIFLLPLSGFPLCLWPFWVLCVWVYVNPFTFIILRVHWASWMCRLMFFMKFAKFSALISLVLFIPFSYLLLVLPFMWILGPLNGVSHSFFSLFFWLHSLYSSISKFTDSFFCWFKYMVEPLQWNFHFSYCTSWLQNFHLVPFKLLE